jgi:hypothetical protein
MSPFLVILSEYSLVAGGGGKIYGGMAETIIWEYRKCDWWKLIISKTKYRRNKFGGEG